MKKGWESLKMTFAIYSRIPVFQVNWEQADQSYLMCFFPLIGSVIGAATLGAYQLGRYVLHQETGITAYACTVLLVLLPLWITGGIHMDGFMDTLDALGSCRPKEEKLEILKDVHTGAFAVLGCAGYLLLYTGIYSCLTWESVTLVSAGFILSRTLSGLSVVTFPMAREKGMLSSVAEKAKKRVVQRILLAVLLILCAGMVWLGKGAGILVILAAGITYWRYCRMCLRQFGGITGDLAGYFLQTCEIVMAGAAVLGSSIF